MKEGITRGWKQINRRITSFEHYVVTGIQFESPPGERGWQVMAWPHVDPVHDYWVEDGKLYRIKLNLDPTRLFEVFDEAPNVDPAEKEAVLQAIAKWESE